MSQYSLILLGSSIDGRARPTTISNGAPTQAGQVAAPPTFVRLAAHPLRWRLPTELADSDYRVRELVPRVDQPQNLVSYHLRLLRDGGLVTATRSSFDGRDSYYHLDLDRCADALTDSGAALHPALRRAPDDAATAGRNRTPSSSTTWMPRSPGCAARVCPSAATWSPAPGGRQILLADPDGNLIELFQPAHRPEAPRPATP